MFFFCKNDAQMMLYCFSFPILQLWFFPHVFLATVLNSPGNFEVHDQCRFFAFSARAFFSPTIVHILPPLTNLGDVSNKAGPTHQRIPRPSPTSRAVSPLPRDVSNLISDEKPLSVSASFAGSPACSTDGRASCFFHSILFVSSFISVLF